MRRYSMFFIIVFIFIISFYGCQTQYGIVNSGGEPIYFTKPIYKDSSVHANYVGGKYSHTVNGAFRMNESSQFGEVYYFHSYTQKYYNFSYGLFGYTGLYDVTTIDKYNGKKTFYGMGLSSEVNLNIPLSWVDLRILGIKGTLLFEDGQFASFRKKAENDGLINNVSKSNLAYNISSIHEIEFKLRKGSFGINGSYGTTIFSNNFMMTLSSNLHYTNNRITVYFQNAHCFFDDGGISTISLGINYKFK